MTGPPAPRRRRAVELALVVVVGVTFLVQLAALALGRTVLAAACAAVLVASWFVFRSLMKRRGRA